MPDPSFALSLRQPWAALLAHGLKSVEVRGWTSSFRGPVLIHASRIPDDRPEAWDLLPDELARVARAMGGFVGAGEVADCRIYRSRQAFAADQARHLNLPDWFREPVSYGFVFRQMMPLPFRRYPGWVRFFPVEAAEPQGKNANGQRYFVFE